MPVLVSSACYSYILKQNSPIWVKITQFGQINTLLFSAIRFYARGYNTNIKGHASRLRGVPIKTGM
jgi:hypothetical protein